MDLIHVSADIGRDDHCDVSNPNGDDPADGVEAEPPETKGAAMLVGNYFWTIDQ